MQTKKFAHFEYFENRLFASTLIIIMFILRKLSHNSDFQKGPEINKIIIIIIKHYSMKRYSNCDKIN